jgi:hypothetical protein
VSELNCCWPSPALSFLASGLFEIYDQDFCSPLDMYVFRNGASSCTRGGVDLSEALRLLHRSSTDCPVQSSPVQSSKLLLALASTVILGSESHGSHDHILLCDDSGCLQTPDVEDQVPVFMSPSDRVAQLYPQAPGSIFIIFYDSQG